ncbi:MAG TPA: peptidase domain-containing ABC transporter [Candidatus Coprenecus stercoravium]|uniref:Peptidase domain-containing ABC transporter n=1 Tax=Candidatus Coprenecus stercoravium TaxID=2840735 RepID=A0A9D2KAP9_9BACT|nr:peptidase domain-containing ABC transporter [Candidatus Coprenecus stercoravium]
MKKEIQVRQHDRSDCAAACIASVCAFYGLRLPMIKIRSACGTTPDGTTMQGIVDAFGKLGMDSAGLKAKEKNAKDLSEAGKPVILHLEKKTGWLHFVVLYKTEAGLAVIMDPEDGKMHRLSLESLLEEWSGYIVAASPSPGFVKGDCRTDIRSRLKEILTSYRKELLLVLAGSAALIAAGLSISVFLQRLIDSVIPSGDPVRLTVLTVILLSLTALTCFISYMRSILLLRVSLKIDARLIISYFRKLFSLPVSFFDSMSSGELNSRVSDAYRIRSFITERLLLMAVSIITLVCAAAILASLYWKLTLTALCLTPLFVIIYKVSDRANRRLQRDIIEKNALFEQTNIGQISCARAIRYFNSGKEAAHRIENRYRQLNEALYKGGAFTSAASAASDTVGHMISVVTLVAGAFFVLSSELTVGELISFYTISTVFSSPIVMLIDSNREIAEARISAERIFDILDLPDEHSSEEHIQYEPSPGDKIEVRHLSFSFPGRDILFDDLSFEIHPGAVNLIKGPNGCGKSTLAALLMRGYSPLKGRITVGGVDISVIPPEKWRRFISIVPQKPDIFDGSILDNIIMGERDYDLKAVSAACAMAGLAGTLESMPGGVMAHTGEHACRLSGGERQKVALARALYRRPGVLILDEAASNLDSDSKSSLESTVRMLCANGITVVLISHDSGAENIADHIIDLSHTNAHSQA